MKPLYNSAQLSGIRRVEPANAEELNNEDIKKRKQNKKKKRKKKTQYHIFF